MVYFRSSRLAVINESILSDDSTINSVKDNLVNDNSVKDNSVNNNSINNNLVKDNSVKDNSIKLKNHSRYNDQHKIENDQKRARKERREYSRRLMQQKQSENINWMKTSSDFIVKRFIICCIN